MKPRADTVAASCRSDARHPCLFFFFFSFYILLILRPKWFEFLIDIMGETQKIGFSCLPYVRFCVNIWNNINIVIEANERFGKCFDLCWHCWNHIRNYTIDWLIDSISESVGSLLLICWRNVMLLCNHAVDPWFSRHYTIAKDWVQTQGTVGSSLWMMNCSWTCMF
jgi:hypothetical protein